MAHVLDTPLDTLEASPKNIVEPAEIDIHELEALAPAAAPIDDETTVKPHRPVEWSGPVALISAIVLIVALGLFGFYFASSYFEGKAPAAKPAAAGSPIAGSTVNPVGAIATQAAQFSPAEIKEMKARDDYAARLSTFLHQRMPAYKNVKIYADSWAGNKAPVGGPLTNVKLRKGDNLMMVFWSPEAGTARALADFTKSPAAVEAVNAGFAEFQFVDPDTYCYSLVAPVTGAGAVTCGIR